MAIPIILIIAFLFCLFTGLYMIALVLALAILVLAIYFLPRVISDIKLNKQIEKLSLSTSAKNLADDKENLPSPKQSDILLNVSISNKKKRSDDNAPLYYDSFNH